MTVLIITLVSIVIEVVTDDNDARRLQMDTTTGKIFYNL